MKYVSVAIPCYNSAEYMSHAIESVLVAGDDIEILVINDGSSDDTEIIGKKYEKQYPGIVKCISKENGGHGSAVNEGLKNASGIYYKVLDSDDWFDKDAFISVVDTIKKNYNNGTDVDMYIANYVYNNQAKKRPKIIRYKSVMPVNKVFGWNDVKHFRKSQNILMHAVIYKTSLLRENDISLPEHTFYVDNIFVYEPLPYVKKMYYMDEDLYRYYIGREDQSVNEKIMLGRIDQQIKITKVIIDSHDITVFDEKKLSRYMNQYLIMMMTISSVFLLIGGTDEHLGKKQELWDYLYKANPAMYKMVAGSFLGRAMRMKTAPARKLIICVYRIARKVIGFS